MKFDTLPQTCLVDETILNGAETEEQYGKTELFDLMFADKPLPPGEVVVVIGGSFIDGELLCCATAELRQRSRDPDIHLQHRWTHQQLKGLLPIPLGRMMGSSFAGHVRLDA